MNDQNQGGTSSAPEEQTLKRKRGCPPKDNSGNSAVAVEELNETIDGEPPSVVMEDNLLGQTVSGVLSGSFDDGYFVTVKPQNSNITLTGLVFCPGKVLPITPENDLAPMEIMHKRISPVNEHDFQTPKPVDPDLDIQVTSTSGSKSENKIATLMIQCDPDYDTSYAIKGHELSDQGFEFQAGSYYTPVENLQDYRIVDHDEIMKEFEASACMNAPSASTSKPDDYRLESTTELQHVYPENLVSNDAPQNQEATAADTCLKLMESVQFDKEIPNETNCPSEAHVDKSFDVNERPSIDEGSENQTRPTILLHSKEHVRSDLQLGLSTEDLPPNTFEKKKPEKPSEAPFFFNLTGDNSPGGTKKSVTESFSFTRVDSQATLMANDSTSDQPTQETVSSELKLSAAAAAVTSIPTGGDALLNSNASRTETDA